jgi:trehalose 6-phosphate phosphatase
VTRADPGLTSAREAAERARALLDGGRTLLVSDFDGTIAGLVADPWSAAIVPAARRALRRLATHEDVEVAFLSGRTALDLADRVRVGGASYLGDHGSQRGFGARGFRPSALQVTHDPVDPELEAVVRALVDGVPRSVPEPWLVIEDKGAAVTFHVRTAPDVDAARARVLEACDAIDPGRLLVRSGGRRALELRPPDATHKGTTLRRLIEERQPAAVIALGDDPSDVLAFEVLRKSRAAGRLSGLAIGVAGRPEVSVRVAPHADLMLASAAHAARFLSLLARIAPRP